MLKEDQANKIFDKAIEIINACLKEQYDDIDIDEILKDRKLFERKETTDWLLSFIEKVYLNKMCTPILDKKRTSHLALFIAPNNTSKLTRF